MSSWPFRSLNPSASRYRSACSQAEHALGVLKKRGQDDDHTFLSSDVCLRLPSTVLFSPTAESFVVSAQIGSGVVRGDPEVRFHEGPRGSTRVHEVLRGLRGGASTKKSTACCWGYHVSLLRGPFSDWFAEVRLFVEGGP